MLLTNGRIYLMDRAHTVADTLVVRNGRVAFAGRREDVNVPGDEPVLDLGGCAVLPGLVDGHAHLTVLARAHLALNVAGLRSEEEVAGVVAAAAARARPGEWITGRGWDQTLWPDQRFPSRHSLDRAAPANPVALTRVDGHAVWVNAAALRAAGVSRDTPDPDGGVIIRDTDGAPTGLLLDTAQELVQRVLPRPSPEQLDRALRDAVQECLAKGLTGVHEMGLDLEGLAAFQRLIARGDFPFRVYAAVAMRSGETWAFFRERGPATFGDGRLVVRAVKILADGALGSRGAALHAPYSDDPNNHGLLLLPPKELERQVRAAAARGFQVCVHAIGDRANTLVLDTFATVLAEQPGRDHRFRVEHAQVLAAADIPRFRQLGVIPSMQPIHCVSDMRWAGARLGPERLRGAYAWRSLLDTGVPIAGGSDVPVEDPNPFFGLYAAVARRPLSGEAVDWQPEQRMTRLEAVRAFTVWNAYAAFQEQELGTLEPGRRADLVVLSTDVFTCPAAEIKDITPLLTMVDGEVVYRREG